MIQNFNNFILEKYSLPDSCYEVSDLIFKFITSKLELWKKTSNQNFKINSQIIPDKVYQDFPINKIKIGLEFVSNPVWKGFKSKSHHFGSAGLLKPKIYENGMLDIGLEFKIFLPKEITEEKLKKYLIGNIYHEVLHSFQSFKKETKGIKEVISNEVSFLNLIRKDWATLQNPHLSAFIRFAYITSNRNELDAFLASMHSPFNKERALKEYHLLFDLPEDELKTKILNEVKDESTFVKSLNKSGRESFWKERFSNFEDFFNHYWNRIQRRKDYLFKKISKI